MPPCFLTAELFLGVMIALFVFENVHLFPGFSNELALYSSLLFVIGFIVAFQYRREETMIIDSIESLKVDKPTTEIGEPQDEFSSLKN